MVQTQSGAASQLKQCHSVKQTKPEQTLNKQRKQTSKQARQKKANKQSKQANKQSSRKTEKKIYRKEY